MYNQLPLNFFGKSKFYDSFHEVIKIFNTYCATDLDKLNLVKLGYGSLVLGSSQLLILPQIPLKIVLTSKG